MSIRSEVREEREDWLKSGRPIGEFYKMKKEQSENVVYTSLKQARYKGIELCENDIIVNSGNQYIIRNFTEKSVPIVTLLSNVPHNYFDREWEFGDNLQVLKSR